MSIQHQKYSAEEVAQRGDDIYERKIRTQMDASHHGKIVAIDVDSGLFDVGETMIEAADRLRQRAPDAIVWCLRVGFLVVHHFRSPRIERE